MKKPMYIFKQWIKYFPKKLKNFHLKYDDGKMVSYNSVHTSLKATTFSATASLEKN